MKIVPVGCKRRTDPRNLRKVQQKCNSKKTQLGKVTVTWWLRCYCWPFFRAARCAASKYNPLKDTEGRFEKKIMLAIEMQ